LWFCGFGSNRQVSGGQKNDGSRDVSRHLLGDISTSGEKMGVSESLECVRNSARETLVIGVAASAAQICPSILAAILSEAFFSHAESKNLCISLVKTKYIVPSTPRPFAQDHKAG
jgi:hypothetical protein